MFCRMLKEEFLVMFILDLDKVAFIVVFWDMFHNFLQKNCLIEQLFAST